jgi:hypothetical protein
MPFRSEKQRRYLWATQPDLAKRWANKYPESNKNLPMYANEDKKAALSTALQHVYNYVNARTFVNTSILAEKQGKNAKNAADECVKVKIPHSNRPTYAGEEREKGEIEDTKVEPGQNDVRQPANAINSLLQKISAVLAQPILQAMENETAAREGRQPVHQPKNHGIKRYPQATPSIPLPMGMQAPAQPAAQPRPAPAQPQKSGAGMNSPSANPINSFGALSMSGNINGNAAFGIKNSPDSLKTGAAQSEFLAKVTSMDFPPYPDPEDLELDDDERTKTAVHSSVNAGNVLGGMEAGHREANKLHQVPMTYGAGLGGAIGLLHEYARNKSPAEKTQPLWRKTLRYAGKGGVGALAGTGVGAIAGNMSSDTLTNRLQNAKNQQYQTAQDSLNNLAKELWRNSPDAEPDLNIAGELARDNTSMISQIYRNLLEKRNGVRAVGAAGQHVKEAARLS